MATLIKGILSFNLDWQFVFVGVFLAIVMELCGIKSLSFAVGAYLPLSTTLPIFAGGLIKGIVDWRKVKKEGIAEEEIRTRLLAEANKVAADRAERFGPDIMAYVERSIVLQTLDHLWREHIVNLDHLRSVVGFRGYAQRDPLNEYKGEAFELFQAMLGNLRQAVTAQLMRVELVREAAEAPPLQAPEMHGHHLDGSTGEDDFGETALLVRQDTQVAVAPEQRDPKNPASWGKVGRNEPCPCGSGKKYKHCHGAFA